MGIGTRTPGFVAPERSRALLEASPVLEILSLTAVDWPLRKSTHSATRDRPGTKLVEAK